MRQQLLKVQKIALSVGLITTENLFCMSDMDAILTSPTVNIVYNYE